MSNDVLDAIRRVIPLHTKRSARGWINFDCPCCADSKMRGGLLETASGGFRYQCFNGGCDWENATGWEPGAPFAGRARQLFLALGGDLTDIAPELLTGRTRVKLSIPEWITWMMSDASALMINCATDTTTEFPEIELPDRTQLLWEAEGQNAVNAQNYVLERGEFFRRKHAFCWSPKYPLYVIIPLLHHNKIIGWIGRRTIKDKGVVHLKCPNWPTHYMLNQNRLHERRIVLVVQGAFDAIAIDALCTFGNTLSQRQINLLNQSGKQIVLVPDYKGTEWRSYWQVAKQNNWSLAIPEWGGNYGAVDHIKDPGDAIKRMGLLCTMQKLMDPANITDDYKLAELTYIQRSRGFDDRRGRITGADEFTRD